MVASTTNYLAFQNELTKLKHAARLRELVVNSFRFLRGRDDSAIEQALQKSAKEKAEVLTSTELAEAKQLSIQLLDKKMREILVR